MPRECHNKNSRNAHPIAPRGRETPTKQKPQNLHATTAEKPAPPSPTQAADPPQLHMHQPATEHKTLHETPTPSQHKCKNNTKITALEQPVSQPPGAQGHPHRCTLTFALDPGVIHFTRNNQRSADNDPSTPPMHHHRNT